MTPAVGLVECFLLGGPLVFAVNLFTQTRSYFVSFGLSRSAYKLMKRFTYIPHTSVARLKALKSISRKDLNDSLVHFTDLRLI